uniref:Alpha 1,4-glycosyltransferase domain-containing protein n=1 Tax=Kalanchoe fedtschenkoi TaxID=63787 RepID=A0A7N0THH8_KALFE
MIRSRRRPHYGAYVCALTAAVLLLLSVALLHSRLTISGDHLQSGIGSSNDIFTDSLLDDPDFGSGSIDEDRIDEHDVIVNEDNEQSRVSDEDGEDEDSGDQGQYSGVSGYYFDHVSGVIRRAFDKRSIDEWADYIGFEAVAGLGVEDKSKGIFGSDDVPVDEEVRRKIGEVSGVEDALLLKTPGRKVSPLREGWGMWFDAKSDFLRRDRMFKSNLELLNPLNNPLLQDPDGVGITGLTRGDKLMYKDILNQFKKVSFNPPNTKQLLRNTRSTLQDQDKHISADESLIKESNQGMDELVDEVVMKADSGIKRTERKTLDHDSQGNGMDNTGEIDLGHLDRKDMKTLIKSKSADHIYADGKRWGYFPGLHPHLSFSRFVDNFFRKGKCSMRVFMVWNSAPWMYTLRLKRSFETLLLQHQEACVVVFSETVELDFFGEFVTEGFKVAVAMPNLDELLKGTPTKVFASVWSEWRKTKFYPTHYSELVRLAALYKYGGIYLDSDVLVLKPLSSLNNSIGQEDSHADSPLSGAVMAFRRHSPYILECLKEFHLTYDETKLRWNGAELLSRAAKKFMSKEDIPNKQTELNVLPSSAISPISRSDIKRYFDAPTTEDEKQQHDLLFKKIINESFTFHLWSSNTFSLLPEPESLVARLIGRSCIHCSDVL